MRRMTSEARQAPLRERRGRLRPLCPLARHPNQTQTWQETRFLVPILILECSNLLRAVRASSVLRKRPMVTMESPRHSGKHSTVGGSWWWSCSRRRDCFPPTPLQPSSRPSTPRCSRARCASSWRSGRSGRRWWPLARHAPRPRLRPPPRPRLWIQLQPEHWGPWKTNLFKFKRNKISIEE